MTKNDLADPFLFGLSAGASAGVVAVISHFDLALGQWSLPVAAFAGATLSAVSVILVFFCKNRKGVERLILSGLAVSFLFSAITGYLIYTGDQRSASNILFGQWGLRAGKMGKSAVCLCWGYCACTVYHVALAFARCHVGG